MRRNLTFPTSLPLRILKPLLFPLTGIALLFSFAFGPTFLIAPGLTNPEPVGAYLNGNFPLAIESEIQLRTPFTATSFSAILATAAEPASTRIHFAQRGGTFYWLSHEGNGSDRTLFMNISGRVWTGQDSGVLGMAFHPDYNKPGNPNRNFFYVYYVTSDGTDEYLRLSRFTRNEAANLGDPNSESVLIEQVLGPTLHRGGGLQFGNDGFLYLAIGDLGWTTQSQNITDRLSGGVFRIDVDKRGGNISHPVRRTLQSVNQGTTGDYYIPNDNPFLATDGSVFEEYYTLGCRNPHRMTIDRVTGDLYIGNVGSNSGVIYEEVNRVAKGANFGWPYREGYTDRPDLMARPTTLIGTETDPIHAYDHSGGNSWVLGGYVYRGSAMPNLYGKYIFADGGSRKIWALDLSGSAANAPKEEIVNSNSGFYSFAEDQEGELYITSNAIQKLHSIGNTVVELPQLLSQTGAFSNLATLEPQAGIIPYDMITSLWSDGAEKYRWLSVPNDGTHNSSAENIVWSEEGEWGFPVGSVFIKHFEIQTDKRNANSIRRLETRFLIHGETGYYAVTYRWRPDGSDAELLNSSFEDNLTIIESDGSSRQQTWYYPSRSECFVCHTEASGRVLGPKTRHLNRDILYPSTGLVGNQVETYNHLGMFDQNVNVAEIANFLSASAIDDQSASIEDKARSYLDVNCSSCHRPGGGTRSNWNALLSEDLAFTSIVNGEVVEDMGIEGAKIVVPGDTAKSVLYQRLKQVGTATAMPPLAKDVQHQEGVALIAEWINSMPPNAGEVTNGLMATYYDNIDFTNEAMQRIDRQINFNWDLGTPSPAMGENTFSVRWEGLIEAPTTGTYTFYLRSDDGVRLWIDNQMVIENWTVHAPREDIGTIELQAGQRVPIKLDYFENGGHAVAELRWSSSEIQKQYVPESALFLRQGGTGLMATYYDNIDFTNEALQRIDPVVDFSWGGGAPTASMDINTFSVRWKGFIEVPYSGTYTFYTASDDGVRLWVNGQQLINDWRDHGVLENSGTITLVEGEMVPIQLDYYENGGGAVVKLSWSGNGIEKQIIPRTVLYPVGPDVDGTIAHWPLDFDASDAIGNAHGELQGGAILVDDFERGRVLSVDNPEAHVLVNPKPQLQVGTEGKDFSIAFWMNLTQSSTGAWRSIMHKGESNSQRTFAMWMRPSDNRIHYRITTDANGNEGGDSQTPLPVNQWSHIAYVKEGQSLKLYINGVVDHETTLVGSTVSNNGNLYFGDTPWYPAALSKMDDIRLYGYPISPAEIADLMLPPSCTDFFSIDGEGLDIGSGGGQTYMVGTNNFVYKWNECARNWGLFSATPAASRIDVDGEGNPWITATDQKIYRWNGSAFQQLPGAAVEIGVGENTVFVVNVNGDLYQFNGSSWNIYTKPSAISRVDVRNGQPWIVTQDNSVYQYHDSNWLIKGDFQAKDISISDKDAGLYVLSKAGEVHTYEGNGVYASAGASNGENLSVGNEGNIWVLNSANQVLRKQDCEAAANPIASNGGCDSGTMLMETWPIAKWQWYFHHTNEVPFRTEAQASKMLTSFEVPSNMVNATDNGVRLRGYITPPVTGEYTFWISSVMASELWISSDEDPVKGQQICHVYTSSGYRQWNRRKGQQSAPIMLEAGKRYYIEAFGKMRNSGSDHLSVGWQLPDGTLERPITGAYLSPYIGQEDTEAPSVPGTPVVTDLTSDGVSLKWNHSTDNIGVEGYFIYQDGNSVPVDSVIQGDSTNIYGLGAASTHLFAVAAYDAEGNLSEQSQAIQVTTKEGCNKVAIYYDDFEEGTGIWNLTNSTSKWARRPDLATSGNYVITMAGDSDTSFFETQAMDLERFEEISLDFTFHVYEYFYWSDVLYLQVSTDGGNSYRTVEHWDYRSGDLINNRQEYKRITFNGPFSNQTKIRFTILERNSRRNGYVHFDDVSIEGCEVEGCEGTQNLALGRTARQSSTYGNGVAGLAVDGNLTGTSPWSADLQHTNNEAQPWWEVDLEVNSKVDSVRIHNRSDCCTERQKDFYVLVSDQPMAGSLEELLNSSSVHAIYYPNQAGAITTFPVNAAGRYVRIQLKGSSQMHLAEVEVLGCNLEQICVPPVVSIDDPGVIAEDGETIQLSASPAGGVWSGASTDGSFDPTQGAGLYEVIYTYEEFAGCSGADTLVFEVLPAGNTCDNPTNLALGQSVSQSSTYGQGLASLAVDGNRTGTSPWSADLQHTTNEAQPWWQVDLGQKSLINSLDIYNRSDALPERLNNFYVLVSDLPISSSATLDQLLANGSITQVFFSGAAGFSESISLDAAGRYVRIQLSGSGLLHLAEVEVMGCALGGCVDPVVSIENLGPFGEDAGVQQLIGQPAGGVWSGAVSATGIFDPSQGVGSYEVIYSYTDGQGCSNSAIELIDVLPGGGCASPENLALNKSASQSSTYGNGVAGLATDGIQNGTSPWSADLSHTSNEAQPWWEVDLGGLSNIQQVKIYNRTDCCFDRLRDFYILSSSTPFAANASLDQLLADPNVSSSFISGPATIENIYNYSAEARYVRIQLSGSGLLHIAEVEVWGCSSENDPCFGAQSASIDPVAPIKPGSGAIQLSASPAGGEWSGASTDGSFDPGNCPGSYEVIYTYLNGGVCVSADTTTILVQSDTMDVFIYAGQSNATGVQGASQNLALGSSPYDAQISYAWNIPTEQSSNGWDILQPLQVGANQQGHGAEISFGRLMFSMGYNNLGIIKVAEGGTSLAGSWDPTSGLSGYNATSNQGMYPEMLSYVNARLAELDAQGQPYRLAGVLWHQGEGDMNATMADVYKDNLIEFVNILRSDLGSDLQVFAASVYNSRATTEDEETVRKAQRDAAAEVSGLFVVNLDSVYYDENFDLNTANIPDGLHYNSQGQVKVGNAFASAYQTFYPLAGCGEGPSGICPTSENLALNQPASQSSTYGNGLASLAVDGNTVGSSPWTADLQHTTTEAQPWWQVDLGAVSTIEEVKIYNRSDCCAGRLNNFYILLSDEPFDPSKGLDSLLTDPAVRSINFSGAAGLLESINIAGTGRYVRIQHTRETQLHLAEVEVWGCGATGQGTRFSAAQEESPESVASPMLSLYPNPTSRFTNIEIEHLAQGTQIQYGLFTLTGQRVWSKEGGLTEKIDVQGLAKGVYLLKVQAGEWSEVKKLIVE